MFANYKLNYQEKIRKIYLPDKNTTQSQYLYIIRIYAYIIVIYF